MAKSFAYICSSCRHPISGHRLAPSSSDVVAGPYRCLHKSCTCEVPQHAQVFGMTEPQFRCEFPGWPTQLRIGRRRTPHAALTR